jgi:hypothetical protein
MTSLTCLLGSEILPPNLSAGVGCGVLPPICLLGCEVLPLHLSAGKQILLHYLSAGYEVQPPYLLGTGFCFLSVCGV